LSGGQWWTPATGGGVVGRGVLRRWAAESCWLVAVSAGSRLTFVSWWSCSFCPNLTRSEGSSGGVHHLRVGRLPFLCSLGVLGGLLVGLLCFICCS
jgi:hypothetical protein